MAPMCLPQGILRSGLCGPLRGFVVGTGVPPPDLFPGRGRTAGRISLSGKAPAPRQGGDPSPGSADEKDDLW